MEQWKYKMREKRKKTMKDKELRGLALWPTRTKHVIKP